jgi:hypothetical protein
MLNYEPPVEFSIFDFQNLDFGFMDFDDFYFLKIYSVNPISSYHLLQSANREFVERRVENLFGRGLIEDSSLDTTWDSNADNWGILFRPSSLNKATWEFFIDISFRLSSRSQDLKGVLDTDIYMDYIRKEAGRFWDSLNPEMRMTLLMRLNLDDVDRVKYSRQFFGDIYHRAYNFKRDDLNQKLATIGIVKYIMNMTLEVNRYAGSSI